jgi:uncharacterized protein (DUF302 family)
MHAKTHTRTKPDIRATDAPAKLDYAHAVTLPGTDGAAALERAKSAFGREGFGVVAEIDFRDTLQRKLDKDIGPYWVLEICNPKLADRALAAERKAGLLMPCKVAVWQEGKDAVVAALHPEVAVGVTGNATLATIAEEAQRHIERALVRLEAPERELSRDDES